MLSDSEKVVIITGAARGMGQVMATALLENGYTVACVDVDNPALESLTHQLKEFERSGRLLAYCADISVAETAPRIVASILERCGAVHGLINNAGLPKFIVNPEDQPDQKGQRPRLWEVSHDQFNRYFDVQVLGAFNFSKAAIPPMIAGGRGRVVNVTTNFTTMLEPGTGPYGPSKAANEAMAAVLAQELDGTGVTVNVLNPGGKVSTRPLAPGEPAALRPEIMAEPIRWLMSDASSRCTGKRIRANAWDTTVDPSAASEEACFAIAWPVEDVKN